MIYDIDITISDLNKKETVEDLMALYLETARDEYMLFWRSSFLMKIPSNTLHLNDEG